MNRRQESRLYVEFPGACMAADGSSRRVYIADLSPNGCRFIAEDFEPALGDVVELSLGPVGTFAANVRWRVGSLVGVEFHAALQPAIFSHFAAYCRSAA